MTETLNETQGTGPDGATLLYLRVSSEGRVQRAVAYVRTSATGAERALALIAQQNALQQFADDASYEIGGWYMEGDGVELNETTLSRLMADVVVEGREFNAVLVWNYARLGRDRAELAELRRKFREHGVGLVSATQSGSSDAFERQLAAMYKALGDEAAH